MIAIICAAFIGFTSYNNNGAEVYAENKSTVLTLQIGNPKMTVNGEEAAVDDSGTAPVIVNDRTFLPIRFIAEDFGWTVKWNDATREVTIIKPATEEEAKTEYNIGTNCKSVKAIALSLCVKVIVQCKIGIVLFFLAL